MLKGVRGANRSRPLGDYVAGRAEVLARLAHLLTGDSASALDAVSAALTGARRLRGPDDEVDRRLTAAVVRAARRCRPTPTGTPLDRLTRSQRASVVLAFAVDWDAEAIAEVRRTTPGRVRRQVAAGLRVQPEAAWRALLDDPAWAVRVPADLPQRVRRSRTEAWRHRRRVLLAVGSSATAVAGLLVAIERVATTPPPAPPTAHDERLLAWAPRGPLARDSAFVAAATRRWRAAPDGPTGDVYVLYAGVVGIGRLAVLQSVDPTHGARVAVVGDHDTTYRHTRLRVEIVAPLDDPSVPALAIPYDGNLNLPGLTTGEGSRVEQLLVGPDVRQVAERDLRSHVPGSRANFVARPLTDGMSEPWLDLTGAVGSTAVRVTMADGSTFTGLLEVGSLQPVPVSMSVQPLPRQWEGLPHAFPPAALRDDVLWWAQECGVPEPSVQLVWVGRLPGLVSPARMELVRCPGGGPTAQFLVGFGDGTRVLGTHSAAADVYANEVPSRSFGLGSVVVIGSTRVFSIKVGGRLFLGRTAQLPLSQAGPVEAWDAHGHRLPIR